MNTDQLVGKHILTGLTWTDARGKLLRRTEYHGIIVSAGNGAVCFKRAEDDGEFTIPLDPGSLQPADPEAVYTLSESGKTVTGVDYVSVWTIHPAAEKIK